MTVLSAFSLIPPLPRLCLKLQATAIGWLGQRGRLRSLSRGQTSIFIDMPLCLQCENIILDSRGKGKKKIKHENILTAPVSHQCSHKLSKTKDFFFQGLFFYCREVGVKSMNSFRWKSRTKKGGGCNWIKCSHIISVIIITTPSLEKRATCWESFNN